MTRTARLAAAALLVLVTAAPAARGQGPAAAPSLDAFGLLVATQSRPSFSIVGAGARPAGMGGAFTALADDASAASFNPAGLALLLTPEASLVLDGQRRRDHHDAFLDLSPGGDGVYGASATRFDTAGVNFASFTVPFTVAERNLCLQLSYHRLIDFTFDGRRDFPERASVGGAVVADVSQRVDQEGDVGTFSLAAAYQLTQRLSLGLTLSRWEGAWSFDTRTAERDVGAEEQFLRFRQDNAWSGWNVTGGMLLRYRYLNAGFAFRSEFEGDYTVDSRLETSFATPFADRSRLDGTLTWPNSWTAGLALKPLQTWFVTADYTEYDWDDMVIGGLGSDGSGEVSFFDLRPPGESSTRNTGTWRFGSEVTLFPGGDVLALRAGYALEPRPQLLSPADEKSSVRTVTLGAGWRRGPVSVDVAYQRGTSTARVLELVDPETVATGSVEAQAVGRVATDRDRLFLAVLYHFDGRRSLRDLFHFLFVGPLDRDGGEAAGEEPRDGDAGDEAEAGEGRGEGSATGAGTGGETVDRAAGEEPGHRSGRSPGRRSPVAAGR